MSLVAQLLAGSPYRASWPESVAMSGWRPLPRIPRARFNGATFALRRRGYRAIGDVCRAAGIPDSTFRRWEVVRIPHMGVIGGIEALPESEFERYVQTCRLAVSVTPYPPFLGLLAVPLRETDANRVASWVTR
jgi:hypothetical protein